jgi:hypothetical protein
LYSELSRAAPESTENSRLISFTQSVIRSFNRGDGSRRRRRLYVVSSTNVRTCAPPSNSGRLSRMRSSKRAPGGVGRVEERRDQACSIRYDIAPPFCRKLPRSAPFRPAAVLYVAVVMRGRRAESNRRPVDLSCP